MPTLLSTLPPELLAIIFERLDASDALSLGVLLDPANETRHMNKFLLKHMPIPVLASMVRTTRHSTEPARAHCTAIPTTPTVPSSTIPIPDSIPMAIKYEDKELALSVWSLIEKMLERFKDSFEYSRDDFFENGVNRPTLPTPICFDKPSNVELMRMVLVVYQFNAYCRLLNKSQDDMPFEEAKSTAEQFFKNLTPWEKEQLYSVALTAGIIVPVHRIDRDGILFHDQIGDVKPEDEPDVNGIPSASLKREAMSYTYPKHYKLHLRTPAFTSTTVIWKGFLDGVTDFQRNLKLEELKTRPTPWSVALEKWVIIDCECPRHPCIGILDLLPEQANLSTEVWERLINLKNDSDTVDQAPYRSWQSTVLGIMRSHNRYDQAAKYMACHDHDPWLNVVGYTFWTYPRQVFSWLDQMRDE